MPLQWRHLIRRTRHDRLRTFLLKPLASRAEDPRSLQCPAAAAPHSTAFSHGADGAAFNPLRDHFEHPGVLRMDGSFRAGSEHTSRPPAARRDHRRVPPLSSFSPLPGFRPGTGSLMHCAPANLLDSGRPTRGIWLPVAAAALRSSGTAAPSWDGSLKPAYNEPSLVNVPTMLLRVRLPEGASLTGVGRARFPLARSPVPARTSPDRVPSRAMSGTGGTDGGSDGGSSGGGSDRRQGIPPRADSTTQADTAPQSVGSPRRSGQAGPESAVLGVSEAEVEIQEDEEEYVTIQLPETADEFLEIASDELFEAVAEDAGEEGDLESALLMRDVRNIPGLPPLSELLEDPTGEEAAAAERRGKERARQDEVARARVRSVDDLGRAYGTGRRKTSTARVWIWFGTGRMSVNGRLLDIHFPNMQHRAAVLQPFIATSTLGAFDVMATVKGGGVTGQAGAVRLGISRALQNFDPLMRPSLKEEGLLTRDPRMVERKKPGKAKARKSFQWVKR